MRHPRRAFIALVACGALAAACTSSSPVTRTARGGQPQPAAGELLESPGRLIDQPVGSTGCGGQPAVQPGSTRLRAVAVPPGTAAGTSRRTYWLHVPRHYNQSRLTPLVIAFHGGGGTGSGLERSSLLSVLADRYGFLVAYPQALRQDHGRTSPSWDSSGPADPYAGRIDDGLFVSDMLTSIQAAYCVDPARIWATGISNGGSMTGYLACVLADRIAAFAPVEGVFFGIPGGCHPAHPAAILDVHVLTDPVAPYAGVPSRGSPDYFALAIPAWLRAWAGRDRCAPSPIQHLLSTRGSVTAQWTRCTAGASVIGDVFPAGGHSWFRLIGAVAGDKLMLTFFAQHALSPLRGRWTPGSGATVPRLTAPRIAVRSIRVFRLPEPGAEPFDITAGPDGSMWFTEYAADKIGRIAPDGAITQFTVPTPGAGPYQIASGPGGAIFFTEYNTTKIGRVSPQGKVTEIPIPRPTFGGAEITGQGTGTGAGAGTVLAADPAGYIDNISASGTISHAKVTSQLGLPFAIARLGNGTIWLSELTGYYEFSRHLLSFASGSGKPSRTITLPDPLSDIVALAAGPASSVWFADFATTEAGEIGPDGKVSLFPVGPPYAGISDIAPGPGDAMWISEQDGIVARVSSGGHVSQFALPSAGCNPDGIAAGPGNSVWVTETGADAIAEISLAQRG